MDVVAFLLDGLEKALELERELGVRTVECDRSLLGDRVSGVAGSDRVSRVTGSDRDLRADRVTGSDRDLRADRVTGSDRDIRADRVTGAGRVTDGSKDSKDAKDPSSASPIKQSDSQSNRTASDLVFLHDRPLSPKGVEMMAKILNALGTPDAPIVVAPPMLQAKVTVVLGGLALKRFFPAMRGEPGQWQKTVEGRDVLITYSPEYILRFGAVTPAVEKIKKDMWRSLKAVRQRLG